ESGYPGLHIVHRLDSVTSGLLLFAKDAEAARIMQKLFVGGRVSKRYEAVVRGVPPDDEKVITRGIVRRRGYEFMCSDGEESSAAQTRVWVLERGVGWARVLCEPVTGRTHQIRLHLQDWGYPIWDDPLYGSVLDKSPSPHDSKNSKNSLEGFSESRSGGDSKSDALRKTDVSVTGVPTKSETRSAGDSKRDAKRINDVRDAEERTISETHPSGASKSNPLRTNDVLNADERSESESPSDKPQALQNRSISLVNVQLGFH
ncbi:MAG: hypothetical protein LAT57_13120, partial [Balneolales bacterium]|nr:hypothetical protein [Balneolales bacterium]